MRRLCLLVMFPMLFVPMPASAADALEALLARLKREPPVSEPFQEMRYRRALKAPLSIAGTLTWRGGFDFERDVESPYRETGRIEGRTLVVTRASGAQRIIPLARAPELEILFSGLSALFAGDAQAVTDRFEVEIDGEDVWRLRLVPREEALRQHVPALELLGQTDTARCLILRQAGAQTVTFLDTRTPPSAAPDVDTLIARNCPAP